MGHKGGYKHSGAQGRTEQMTSADVVSAFQEGEAQDISDLARPHRQMAINTLVSTCKSRKAAAAAKVTAATRILEFAEGKPAQVDPKRGEGGIVININRLYAGGGGEQRVIEATEVEAIETGEIIDAIDAIPDSIPIMLEKKR